MNLYISASNRKHNSYNLLNKLRDENDIFLSLADLDIKYCIGCNACQKNEENQCTLKDDMNKIYDAISKCDNIIIMSPIYMNQITGILKNVFDRFNPYCASENLKGKKIFPISDEYFLGATNREEEDAIKLYENHSCNPNCGLRGEITFVAMRDINKDEELTTDYAFIDNEDYKFECACGSEKCRKVITRL